MQSLHRYDFLVLRAIESLMKRHRWTPLDLLLKKTRLSENELKYRLGRLIDGGMVRHEKVPYEGYALVFNGYDTLALDSLRRRGSVHALGSLIGEGKESVVYEGMGLGVVVLKFHRVGQRSFHSARVNRTYMPEEKHCPWVFASALSATQEFEALKLLHPKVSVPLPIDRSRHVVVESFIPGTTLNRCTLEEPEWVLETILKNVAEAYRLGVVHGDLSEYNVMIDDREGVWIIDWPQWVDTTHPAATTLLERDVENILGFFRRKYALDYSVAGVLAEVTRG